MADSSGSTALPFLPGYSFNDPTKTQFHRAQGLKYKNGFSIPQTNAIAGLTQADIDELANMQPSLTYGKAVPEPPKDFVPAHVAFDKKVLLFNAYFKQTLSESDKEYYRVRPVKIYYYLEDDSVSIVEPIVENSGIPQGKLIKRQRLPKNDQGEHWEWKDLNIGNDVVFYGKTFHIYSCNCYTKQFMASEGIIVSPDEECPEDPYILSRREPKHSYKTPATFDKLKQFIDLDRKVLRFYAVWDDRDNMFGEMRPYTVHVYRVDDTVEVREQRQPNDGHDPFPVLIGRRKVPKCRGNIPSNFPSAVMEISEHEIQEWLDEKDFKVGETISIMDRKFFLYDCDDFTRMFYNEKYGVQFGSVPVELGERKVEVKKEIPPYNGFGSPQDSKQNCLSLIAQPPKKDVMKMLENDLKILRYAVVMDSPHPEDKNRKFIISYSLAKDEMQIYEPHQRNAGIIEGKFLEYSQVRKPGTSIDNPEYYTPADFGIGATIEVFSRKFQIVDCDLYVLKYLEANAANYPESIIASIRAIHKDAGAN